MTLQCYAESLVLVSRRYLSRAQDEINEDIVSNLALFYDNKATVAKITTQTFDVVGTRLVSSDSAATPNLQSKGGVNPCHF